MCLFCLKEMNGEKNVDPDDNNGDPVEPGNLGDIDSVSTMDEIIPEMDDEEIPSQEYGEIENELSLEDVRDEEEMNEKDDDEDESEEDY